MTRLRILLEPLQFPTGPGYDEIELRQCNRSCPARGLVSPLPTSDLVPIEWIKCSGKMPNGEFRYSARFSIRLVLR